MAKDDKDNEVVRISISLTTKQHEFLKKRAESSGLSMADEIKVLIREDMEDIGGAKDGKKLLLEKK